MSDIPELTTDNFNGIKKIDDPVILIYWRKDCRYCEYFEEKIEDIKTQFQDIAQIYKFEILDEASRELALRAGVTAVPAVQVIYRGYKVGELFGNIPKEKVIKMIEEFLDNKDVCISNISCL